ncbi:MAG: lytic transglycosylase domain-containing protein [Gemmobacter sp.]
MTMPSAARRTRQSLARLSLSLVLATPAAAGTDPAALCETAARAAAEALSVPLDVLRAVMLTESGRRQAGRWAPWPWAVNMAGAGTWHPDAASAERAIAAALATGARNIDVGCFQINHRWHAHAFDSLASMLDPGTNARYAAAFLRDLHAETGDWTRAAGAYHSRIPGLAERYVARFAAHLANLDAPAQPERTVAALPRTNAYPLLQSRAAARGPSLVPDTGAAGPLVPRAARPLFGEG